jgi:UPF0755 protein
MASLAGKKKYKFLSTILKCISFFVAFALVTALAFTGAVMYLNSPVQPGSVPSSVSEQDGIKKAEDGAYYIDIRRGESSQSAGLRLERAGLIKNRFFWNLICRFEKEHIKSGTYRIELPASPIAIQRILVSGRQILYRVTIPEGVTLKKTAVLFEEAGICSAEDFLNAANDPQITGAYRIPGVSMEGYLFPDTYLFPKEYPAEQAVRTMADNFYRRIENIDPSVLKMSPQELNEKVILASIIEREYRIAEEAPLMAGVFYNRLRINMALQSCATVEYIITEIQNKPHPAVIYNQDLEIRDPYNTYLRPGLPPGAISAPGTVALQAALFPEKTDFFYFRLNNASSGRHYFSKTLDEHIDAGQLFTKGRL